MTLCTHKFSFRLIAFLLLLTMSFGCLAACNGGTSDNTESDSASDSESESASESESEAEANDPLTHTIIIQDPNHAPLADIAVSVFEKDEETTPLFTGCTDTNGTVTFEAPAGQYKATATLEGYMSEKVYNHFEDGATSLTIILSPFADPATQFTVSNVFSHNMVIQRNEHVRVWGWADESQNGKRVSGTFLDTTAHTVIKDGEWVLTFEKKWEANPQLGNTMTIYGEGVEYEFSNVLVGDVYMAIGQSNIHYQVSTHMANTSPDKHGVRNPNALIRLHFNSQTQHTSNHPAQGSDDVCKEIVSNSRWQLPTITNTDRFSALAYYFALNMLEANDNTVPIGLIEVEASGNALSAFLSNEVATATKSDIYHSAQDIYLSDGLPARFVYNQYIYPFEKYAINGIIWYQGESDLSEKNTTAYTDKFIPLMNQMRETHNVLNKEFPIYLMELAYCSDILWNFGGVRAVQGEIAAQLPNTYLIPSCDFVAPLRDLLHPDIKWEQAQRLASVAATVEYGQGTLDESLGPVLVSIELSDKNRTAILTYDHVGSGLKTIDGSETVTGFIPCGTNYEAMMQTTVTATITAPNQITITGTRPFRGIAYNNVVTNLFGAEATLNLCNSYGTPAGACFAYPAEE